MSTAPTEPGPHAAPFVVRRAAAGITGDAFCAHGQLAYVVRLDGYRHGTEDRPEHLDLVLPRCVAAELTGALLALVNESEGEEAFDRLADEITQASDTAAHAIRQNPT